MREEVPEEVPEEIIWWFVGHMKIGRPIVSFASVSIALFVRWFSSAT